MRLAFSIIIVAVFIASCAPKPSQNQYNYNEIGQSTLVDFGTVIAAREIGITGQNSSGGGLVGAGVGAGAASHVGSGEGQIWAVAAGALVGAVAGSAAEQAAANSVGIEYVITTEKGQTMTIAQNQAKGEPMIAPGSRVMVQTQGSYQRVLPADTLPEQIKRPKGIKVID